MYYGGNFIYSLVTILNFGTSCEQIQISFVSPWNYVSSNDYDALLLSPMNCVAS